MSYPVKPSFKLEKFLPEDFELYLSLVQNLEVMQMITERSLSVAEAESEFAQLIVKNKFHPALGNYKILDLEHNQFMGLAKLEIEEVTSTTAELGYMLLPQYWGKGIASQVAKSLIEKAYAQQNLRQLQAIIDPANVASRKILTNNGFSSKEFKDFDGLAGEILVLEFNQAKHASL